MPRGAVVGVAVPVMFKLAQAGRPIQMTSIRTNRQSQDNRLLKRQPRQAATRRGNNGIANDPHCTRQAALIINRHHQPQSGRKAWRDSCFRLRHLGFAESDSFTRFWASLARAARLRRYGRIGVTRQGVGFSGQQLGRAGDQWCPDWAASPAKASTTAVASLTSDASRAGVSASR